MVCLYCGAATSVINSRPQKRLNHIWRRRQCEDCAAVFTTSEAPDLLKSLLLTDGSHTEAFSRDKLFLSLHDSLKHRQTALSDATSLTDTILSKLMPHVHDASLDRKHIVAQSLEVLQRFDRAASVHYQAYHPLRA